MQKLNIGNATLTTALVAALIGIGSAAIAAETATPTDRDQRMNEALQNYRSSTPSDTNASTMSSSAADKNPNPGRFARAEESAKQGVHRATQAAKNGLSRAGEALKNGAEKTGEVIESGARKAGHAVGTGAEKTGEAVSRVGEKIKGSSADKSTTPQ